MSRIAIFLSLMFFSLSSAAAGLDESVLRSAKSGDPYGQALVGWALAVEGNDAEAMVWFRSAILGGYTDACGHAFTVMSRNGWMSQELVDACSSRTRSGAVSQ